MLRSWSRRLENLDLKGKITLALVTGSLLIGGLVALPSFIFARHLLIEEATASLVAEARRERLEIELRLASDMSLAESLANNTVTANALADSLGREHYLVPLLRNQKLQFPGAQLELVDYQGQPVASSRSPGGIRGGEKSAFHSLMETGKAQALVDSEQPGSPRLVALVPVVYRLTGNVEGAIALSIPLTSLLGGQSGHDMDSLLLAGGQVLAGRRPDVPSLQSAAALNLPSPLAELGLAHAHTRPRHEALRDLNIMAVVVGGVGLALIWLVVIFSRRAAKWLARPLSYLAEAAEMAATTGRPQRLQEWSGKDELARVNQAFNRMADRLTYMYDDLEERVENRTEALASSEKRLRYVMDATGEGIWDWDIANDRVFHNRRWCDLLGLDHEFESHDFQVFAGLLHPEDKQDVLAAVEASLLQRQAYFHEHRMVRPDGQVIWVLDRGKVVEFDDHGKPSRMVGSLMDISERHQATEALRERELYLRATLDNLPFLFWLKDTESRFLTVNSEFAKACGRDSADAVVGLTDYEVWPRDLAELYRADDRAVMADLKEKAVEEPVEIEEERRWIETYKKPVVTPEGTVLGTVGFARDITSRKLTEEALERSEQRWQLAVSGTNDGIWDVDFQTGGVFYSDRWKSMLGYGPDEIGNDHEEWVCRIHPDDLERVLEEGQRHMENRTDHYQTEFRMRCKDGSYKWILTRGRALFDAQGKCVRMSGSHTDITDRRAAEAALRERTEQLDAIFCLSPDGFVSFDGERRVRYLNPAFLRMTGLQSNELVGMDETAFTARLNTITRADAAFPSLASLRSEARKRPDRASDHHFIELDRKPRVILQGALELNQAETVPQILYLRDITREKEVEQMKSEFLSTAAHELRTPMASILGFSEVLINIDLDLATRQDLLRTIHGQSELMASILNELLDLARIEARRGKDFVIERVDLRELLEEAVQSYSVPKGRPNLIVEQLEMPLPVSADCKKIKQVISNVLSNAYKYSSSGGEVHASLLPLQEIEGRSMAGIRVTDQGIGMAPEELARVCERFYRADTSGAIPGTGLGMSIVKEIIDLHRGALRISSIPGQGTVVEIFLPHGPLGGVENRVGRDESRTALKCRQGPWIRVFCAIKPKANMYRRPSRMLMVAFQHLPAPACGPASHPRFTLDQCWSCPARFRLIAPTDSVIGLSRGANLLAIHLAIIPRPG